MNKIVDANVTSADDFQWTRYFNGLMVYCIPCWLQHVLKILLFFNKDSYILITTLYNFVIQDLIVL